MCGNPGKTSPREIPGLEDALTRCAVDGPLTVVSLSVERYHVMLLSLRLSRCGLDSLYLSRSDSFRDWHSLAVALSR